MKDNLVKIIFNCCCLFLFFSSITNAQIDQRSEFASFQFGPFNANLQMNLDNHPCVGLEVARTTQRKEGHYFVYSSLAIEDQYLRIGLSSPYVKDFKVSKRTTFTYGIPDRSVGTYYYHNPTIPLTLESD